MSPLDLQTVLTKKPLGLVFDIDGTLSPIAPTPEEARLYPGVAPLLERAREHAHIAIMTGRAIEDGAAMVNVDGLTYIGTHGLEWSDGLPTSHPVEILPEALAYIEPGKYLLDLVEQHLPTLPGVIVQRFDLHGVTFAGDDRTDLDAVLEIARLRQEGIAALAIVVQHPDTLPEMLANADIVVQGVEGMANLLHKW